MNESIETYERICMQMAYSTQQLVISVGYRRAPEFRFPVPLQDCYTAAEALFCGKLLENVKPEDITVIGDSAGGNLTAALTLMAKEKGDFMPKRQILIYPAVWNDYTDTSPFLSVEEMERISFDSGKDGNLFEFISKGSKRSGKSVFCTATCKRRKRTAKNIDSDSGIGSSAGRRRAIRTKTKRGRKSGGDKTHTRCYPWVFCIWESKNIYVKESLHLICTFLKEE